MKRILVVEDDPSFLSLVRIILEGEGCEVISADSVEAGIRVISEDEEGFAAALIDFWLNGRSVLPLLDQLLAAFPDLVVVLITGGGGSLSIEATKEVGEVSGVVHFLQKPFRRSELLKLISGKN